MSKSTVRASRRKAVPKPMKPYPEFPLTPHSGGKWMKKIRGKIHYFGRWANWVNGRLERIEGDGWKQALEHYRTQADDLHAGRTPRVQVNGLTVADLCNRFLTGKLRKIEAGEMGQRMFVEYKEITDLLVGTFGARRVVEDLAADDFAQLRAAMAKRWGPVRLSNAITRTKSVFKYGTDNGLVEKAIRYGSEFRKPDKAVLRRHRAKNGGKMLEVEQLRRLLDELDWNKTETGRTHEPLVPKKVNLATNPQLRAMVLLGLNCGFGNTDIASLACSAVDLDGAIIDFPRPKTGVGRRCPLWPETVAALQSVMKIRPKADSDLVFLNSRGSPWVKVTSRSRSDCISVHFTEAMKASGLHLEGLGFYTLRHVFRTIADAARDPVAIDIIMGHSDPSMGGHYRERVDDARLVAVVNVVRTWLWPEDSE